MKFTNLLTLLAATSALALNFKRDEIEDQLGNLGQALDTQGELENITNNSDMPITIPTKVDDKCSKIVEDVIINCLTYKTDDEKCIKFNTNECQSALKEDIGSCGDPVITYEASISIFKTICATDEKGNICPFAKKLQDNSDSSFTDDDIQEICKSEACYEKALDAFNSVKQATEKMITIAKKRNIDTKEGEEDIAETNKYINALNEAKCKAAHDDNSSGATQIKVGSALLASLVVVLYLF